jgi:acyl dehydratase
MSMPVNELSDRVGQELFVSDWVVVRLEQELAFQAATLLTKEDLGFDPASADPYGPELVSGFLLLSLLVHFHRKHRLSPAEGLYGLNYGTDRVRFLAPVMAGQRVRCRARLRSLDSRADGSWRVVTENTLELEGSQRPAMVADWITYHAPAPASGGLES